MSTLVDISALYAVLDRDDGQHERVNETWRELVLREETIVTTNYVLVETSAMLQKRMGLEALRVFEEDVVPILSTQWVDEGTHLSGVTGLLTAPRKRLSLVDCVSFEVIRRLGIKSVFAFDKHFEEQGFKLVKWD